jgi:hypothetical protein
MILRNFPHIARGTVCRNSLKQLAFRIVGDGRKTLCPAGLHVPKCFRESRQLVASGSSVHVMLRTALRLIRR